jgi:hypothetical protein
MRTAAFILGILGLLLAMAEASVASCPPEEVLPQYRRYFVHCVDQRSLPEKALNVVGLTSQDIGRSFALVAGVDNYPHLADRDKRLEPAAADLDNLVRYLREVQFFDEVVVLRNNAVNERNFKYFFQGYFPARLREFPRSRFLFAYSGHGIQDGPRGYLLQAGARTFDDKANSINMRVLGLLYDEIVDSAHQSLALINACHSGSFHKRTFGPPRRLLPQEPGHHVITAGGAEEQAWHDADVGAGSVFFEKLFAGLSGLADRYPPQADGTTGDGVITAEELSTYLRQEVQIETKQSQNPQGSDISRNGSSGSFFFLNSRLQLQAGPSSSLARQAPSPMGQQAPGPRAGSVTREETQAPSTALDEPPAEGEVATGGAGTATAPPPATATGQTPVAANQLGSTAQSPGFSGSDPYSALSVPTVAEVQEQLRRVELYFGPIDGRWGPASEQAAQDYASLLGRTTIDLFEPGSFAELAAADTIFPNMEVAGAFSGFSCDVMSVGGRWANDARNQILDDLYDQYGCSEPSESLWEPEGFHGYHSEHPWGGFAWRSTVLYYDKEIAGVAHALARDLSLKYQHRFFASRGAGLLVDPNWYRSAIVVHVREPGV